MTTSPIRLTTRSSHFFKPTWRSGAPLGAGHTGPPARTPAQLRPPPGCLVGNTITRTAWGAMTVQQAQGTHGVVGRWISSPFWPDRSFSLSQKQSCVRSVVGNVSICPAGLQRLPGPVTHCPGVGGPHSRLSVAVSGEIHRTSGGLLPATVPELPGAGQAPATWVQDTIVLEGLGVTGFIRLWPW